MRWIDGNKVFQFTRDMHMDLPRSDRTYKYI